MSKHRKIPQLLQIHLTRFWDKINKTNKNECWEWLGFRSKKGYGMFRIGGSIFIAHRVAFYLKTNKDPRSLLVCHTCDNRACCNPAHLFLGTNEDNMQDMVNKKRSCRGENVWQSKLTVGDIHDIRFKCINGIISQRELAKLYKVTYRQIWDIVHFRQWKHIA